MKKRFAVILIMTMIASSSIFHGCGQEAAEAKTDPTTPEITAPAEKEITTTAEPTVKPTAEPEKEAVVTERPKEIDFDKLTKKNIEIFVVIPTGVQEEEDILNPTNEDDPNEASEDDQIQKITGFKDVYVLEGTKDFHPEMAMYYDNTVVTGIRSNDVKVDYSKAGSYDVVYEVSINKEAYEKYVKAPESHKFNFVPVYTPEKDEEAAVGFEDDAKESEQETLNENKELSETAENEDNDENIKAALPSEDDAVIKVEGEIVVVVTAADAEEKADMAVPVYTDNAALFDESVEESLPTPTIMAEAAVEETKEAEITAPIEEPTETAVETPAPTAAPETTSNTATTPAATPKPTAAPTAAPTQAPSTPAPTQTQSTPKPTQSSHTHTWVTEQVLVQAAYDENVQTKAAWDEQVQTKAAWDEQMQTKAAWDEQVLIKEAWDETITEMHTVCNACGFDFSAAGMNGSDIADHIFDVHDGNSGYHEVWIEVGTVHHDAEYTTVHHEAEYTTVHHEAEYTTVHHDAEYAKVHHDAEYTTRTYCSGCGVEQQKGWNIVLLIEMRQIYSQM